MAEPIKHIHEGRRVDGAREDLDTLLETLHRSGTLRLLNGLFGRLGEVSNTLVQPLDTPTGRNIIGSLAVLAESLGRLEPAQVQAAVEATAQTLRVLEERSQRRTPGSLQLLVMLRQRETRRGIYAAIQLLQALGRAAQRLASAAEHGLTPK